MSLKNKFLKLIRYPTEERKQTPIPWLDPNVPSPPKSADPQIGEQWILGDPEMPWPPQPGALVATVLDINNGWVRYMSGKPGETQLEGRILLRQFKNLYGWRKSKPAPETPGDAKYTGLSHQG